MIRSVALKISIFLFVIGFLTSCLKTKEYPDTPVLTFKNFTVYGNNDSAEISFTFKDGDGDLGLNEEDTFPPFNTSSKYNKNIYMKYLYKNSAGVFVPYLKFNKACGGDTLKPGFCDTLFRVYRIQDITPKGQNKILDGEIRIKIDAPFYQMGETPPHKMIKYQIYMYDRKLHVSNSIETNEIVTGE